MQTAPRHQILRTSACIVLLGAINAYICRELFTAEFIQQMGSTAGAFIAISRWATRHWSDLTWYPLWFTGMPFFQIYQPGLHLTVASVATLLHLTPQHAYHLVNALVYCFGPVTLFWLCYRVTGSRAYGLAAGLTYSLLSPSAFLSSMIRAQLGGLWLARRYQTIVYYGDGPHNAVLLLIPLAILCLHKLASERRHWYFPLVSMLIAAILLTNWPGTVGLAMAVAAYVLARLGENPRLEWGAMLASALAAYLLACHWIPPRTLLSVFSNAQQSDGTNLGAMHVASFAFAAVALLGLHVLFERRRVDRWLRFFLYLAAISGIVVLARVWAGVNLLPQGHRFQLEMELAIAGGGAFIAQRMLRRVPARARTAIIVLLVGAALLQLHNYRQYATAQTKPETIGDTVEYRMAKWFEANMPGQRVFAPGSVSIWMNAFADVPQVAGCCDQAVPSFSHRLAYYTLYSAQNAGDRYIPIALQWLKAYGAQAVAVTGPGGKEFWKPYARPEAFRGMLPELWRDGDDVIYQVPNASPSLAHVIQPGELVSKTPVHGLDTGAVLKYVNAIAASPAQFRWMNPHQAQIQADVKKSDVVSVQISYDPGWRVTVSGVPKRTRADALGLLVIEPDCEGSCTFDLLFTGADASRWTRWASLFGLGLAIAWPARKWFLT